MNVNDNELGKLIKRKRKERKLTLEDVAKRVGVGKSTVSKWERGAIVNIKRDKIDALSLILGIDPLTFIFGVEAIKNKDLEFEKITRNEFEQEIYSQLSKNAHIKFSYSAWLHFAKQMLDKVVELDNNQKQQIITFLDLYNKE